jgi:hypothetical protein
MHGLPKLLSQTVPAAVQIVFAKICGWAYGFMITHSPVKKGIEVLYDYGHSYCE